MLYALGERWPIWYDILVLHFLLTGFAGLLLEPAADARLAPEAEAKRLGSYGVGFRSGYRIGRRIRAGGWIAAAIVLFIGWPWGRVIVSIAVAAYSYADFPKFANQSRDRRLSITRIAYTVSDASEPSLRDWVDAAVFIAVTRVIPLLCIAYALALNLRPSV